MSDDKPQCPYCYTASDRDLIEAQSRFVAAIEASHRADTEALKLIADSATALDYHAAVELFIDMLNETASDFGVDAVATLEGMRSAVNRYAAEA